MITTLSIKNYALIEEVQIDFESGFTILTGETGAGKSIVLGALSLLLGKRADLSVIKDTTKKCVVEGEFLLKERGLHFFFNKYNLDFETHTILRRELLPNGKSRAFVNDTPVTLQQMQDLAPYLVDIHNQHDTLSLFSETFHLEVVDALSNNTTLLKTYKKQLANYTETRETLVELLYKKETFVKELDYNTFLYNELKEINLSEISQNDLEESYETLNNIQTIKETLARINSLFTEDGIGTLETAKEARNHLQNMVLFSKEYQNIYERLHSVIIELEDITESLESEDEASQEDPERLSEINIILETLHKLKLKHGVNTIQGLELIQEELSSKIENTLQIEESILLFEKKTLHIKSQLETTAKSLHENRIKSLPILTQKLEAFLKDLGLENARFQFEIKNTSQFKKNGTDTLNLLFTANKGLPFGPLKKVASGGELNRIMLAIKAVLADYKKMPALIFDEIDSGISGEIANKMAEILKKMSSSMQLICITHLPHIAGKGDHHIKIYKKTINNQTFTLLKKLNNQERIDEIAEMIGGKQLTKVSLLHAKQLLN